MTAKKNWPAVKLGEVLHKSKDWIEIDPVKRYKEITVRLWGRGVALRGEIDGAEIAGSRRVQVHTGQFILSRIDARNGAFGLIPKELDGGVVTNDFPVYDADVKRLSLPYLEWMSKTRWFVLAVKESSEGTTNRVRLKEDKFLQIEIPLPSVSEQRRIVTRLDDLVGKVKEATKGHEEVSQEIDRFLLSAFDRITANAPMLPMREVAPLIRRPVTVDFEAEYSELGVRSFGKGTFHKQPLPGSSVGTKRIYWIMPGDLVLSNVFAWEGAIAVVKPKDAGRVGSHRFITRVAQEGVALPEFICFYLLANEGIEKIRAASPGGAGRNRTLGLNKLDDITVPIPSFEEQQCFVRLLQSCGQVRSIQVEMSAELDALVPSLLDRAFKGEL